MILVREITLLESDLYKTFFLKGLYQDEDKFRISPNDEVDAPFPTQGTTDSFTLGAFLDGELTGVVSFQRDGKDREKLRHKAVLFRMYVGPGFRGKGIGKTLIEAVVERARSMTDIEQINLTVVAHNVNAKKLYMDCGFKTFSIEKNAIKWKGNYYSEEQMVLFLE